MRRRVPLLVAVGLTWAGLVGAKGCLIEPDDVGQACTEIGCVDSARIAFLPRLSEPGFYSITIVADGTAIECAVTVPGFARSDACSSGNVWIDVNNKIEMEIDRAGSTTNVSVQEGISSLTLLQQAPRELQVEVRRDGFEVLRSTVTPAYQTAQPNGPSCPGACKVGEVTIPTP